MRAMAGCKVPEEPIKSTGHEQIRLSLSHTLLLHVRTFYMIVELGSRPTLLPCWDLGGLFRWLILVNQTVRVEKTQPCFSLHLLDSAKQWCLVLYVHVMDGDWWLLYLGDRIQREKRQLVLRKVLVLRLRLSADWRVESSFFFFKEGCPRFSLCPSH